MAKILAYDEEARQKLASGVIEAGEGCSLHAWPARPERRDR